MSATLVAKPDKNVQNLKNAIEKVLAVSGTNVNFGIEVVSLKTGEVLYEKNSKNLFTPASVVKLFTCAAALGRLGPSYQFNTEVAQDSSGNLYLIGSGDPSLDEKALEEMAFNVSLHRKEDFVDLIVDQTIFDNIVNGPGWMWDEGEHAWNSPVDALLIDHACVDFWVLPSTVQSPPQVVFRCPSNYIDIHNAAITLETKGELEVRKTPFVCENKIEILGSLAQTDLPRAFRLPVNPPHMYAAQLFRKKLEHYGIRCKGSVHIGKVPEDAITITSHSSLPLSMIVFPALKDSDNLTSNCLFKKLGQICEHTQGSWQSGSKAVRSFLQEKVKMKIDDFILLDGSGESRYNLASPHHVVQCLSWIPKQFAFGPEMMSALSMSGRDGKFMKHRLDGEDTRNKIRAKGGSMAGVSSLAGYVETKEGEILVFAMMINGFTEKTSEIKSVIEDPICKVLANYTRK